MNGGFGNPAGDGLLCIAGQSMRFYVQVTNGGQVVYSHFNGVPFPMVSYGAGVLTNYQFWCCDPGNTCTGTGFNVSNA